MRMRIDYQQGDHLRVGRLLIARARQVESGPIVDGGSVTLFRADEDAAQAVVNEARVLLEAVDSDLTEWPRTAIATAAVKVTEAVATFDEKFTREHFGALVTHRPGRVEAVAVGWLGVRSPNPHRWRPRFLLAHVRWVVAGRPANVYLHESGQFRPKVAGGGQAVEFIERSALGDL